MPGITFEVLGEPKSQPRPKAMKRGSFIHIYTPATAKVWKGLVASAAKPFIASGPLLGALRLSLAFRFARPKTHLKPDGTLRKGARHHHTTKPDADNLAKAVMDALTDAGLWNDDTQVVELNVTKTYAATEGVSVSVEQIHV
jgi:Holliday junction resolvase RusA-like endonuclease